MDLRQTRQAAGRSKPMNDPNRASGQSTHIWGAAKVADILENIKTQHGEVPANVVLDALTNLAQEESIAFFVGS